ncbi:hypothetical protein BJY52DRAFT_164408 [Lactarius psammicola]|nr:hypothetical protein BJY52DRAFT_164408 [Lactarius psammicola]
MPVTTRRQSRSLAQPNATKEGERNHSENRSSGTPRESDDDDPMDGSLAELSSSDEDEEYASDGDEHESSLSEGEESDLSDFGGSFEAKPQAPMAKRRKLEKASPSKLKKSGPSRRVQGRLQNMLSLPLDVLFVIFSGLLPMDLLNLARTSNTLRQVLMSRKSMSVWIGARRNAGATEVPEPPEDMSEPAWAQLLFGPAICSQCSARNIHRVDFALRRRLCTVCRKRNLVFSIKFRSQCPDLKESVMDLLPYTKIGGWAHGHASNSRFYWKPDLYEMGKRMAVLEQDISEGKPGAQKRLKSFRAERILLVDSIIQVCFHSTRPSCSIDRAANQGSVEFEKWAELETEAQFLEAQKRRTERQEALRECIHLAGYDDADIEFIGWHNVPGSNVDKALTYDAWRRIKSKVVSTLRSARENRLLEARRRRESEYKSKAEEHYSDFLRQVLPIQRLYLPAVSQAFELSCFRDLIDLDREVQSVDWEDAATQLPLSLSEWMSGQKERLTSLLPSQSAQAKAMETTLLSSPSIDRWRHRDGAMVNFAGQLDLATSVFCYSGSDMILIGRDACHAWKVKGQLEFSARGAEAVHALLRELRLAPASATVSTLDQLDKRFICGSCPEDTARRHSWKSCVAHFVTETDHAYPQWQVVSPDETGSTSSLVRRERSGNIPNYPFRFESWLCNHCSDYLAPQPPSRFGSCVTMGIKREAIHHVKTEHNIADPMVDVDLFSYPIFM